jgi:hypothetical protein
MHVQAVVTHATSYDTLVRNAILYPLGLPLIFEKKPHTIALDGKSKFVTKLHYFVRFIGGKLQNATNPLCWLDFQAFHMGLNYWKVTLMIRMNLKMRN